ncbi:MAG: SGNH/GDSL hydrolase family protein [Tissierellia bacterium]|nr:SGNH/GDSL hydrolase family protein [Tissierellia bacterium]
MKIYVNKKYISLLLILVVLFSNILCLEGDNLMAIQDYQQFYDILLNRNPATGEPVVVTITNESHVVDFNNRIILNEIPSESTGVVISGKYYTKLGNILTDSNYFSVNWRTGEIVFGGDIVGETITVASYGGRGLIKGYASRQQLVDESNLYSSDNVEDFTTEITEQVNNLSFTGSEHDALVTVALVDSEGVNFGSGGTGTFLNGRLDKWEQKQLTHSADNANPHQVTRTQIGAASQIDLNITNSNVAIKADKSYVDTLIASLVSGSPKGTYATFAGLQTAFPTGDTNIYLVIADGHWYYWNGIAWTDGGVYQSTGIADKAITHSKITDDIYKSVNATKVSNKPASGVIDYLKYTFDGNGLGVSGTDAMTIIYDMLTFDTNISAYGAKIYLSNDTDNISGGVNYPAPSETIKYGEYCNYNKTREYYVPTYRYIHLLIQANVTTAQLTKYYLKNVQMKVGTEYASLVSSGLYNNTTDSVMTEVAYLDESFVTREGYIALNNYKWANKKFVTFGDSITWYDGHPFAAGHTEVGTIAKGYQSFMREELGCTVDNQGVGSLDMTEINTIIQAYDFTDIDAVTITSGANDHRKGILPGTVVAIGSTFDTTKFAGALQASIEKIINSNPDTRIFLITPIRGWYNESGTSDVPGPYNMEMMLSRDYIEVMLAIGELYGIPVCNWYDATGINDLNIHTYIGDGLSTPYYLHPTNQGYKRMADVLIPFLNNN